MADAAPPPRLDPTVGIQPGYAPISWTAVASLGVALLAVLVLGVCVIAAFVRKQPLIEVEFLVLPVLAVVLAFIARRQIANSEGTRTGEVYANAGWWIAAVVGLGYAAYLFALETTVRNDAEREFQTFAKFVADADPANPADTNHYEAILRTIPPGLRAQVRGAKDAAGIDKTFREEANRFRQLDLVRIAGRNPGKVSFGSFGVRDWRQEPTRISCTLTCKMVTPEGEHSLVVPMEAAVEKGARSWQVQAGGSGFMQGRSLTRYGWLVESLETSGRAFAQYFLRTASIPGRQYSTFNGYLRDGGTPQQATREITLSEFLPTVAGGSAAFVPAPPGYAEALAGPLFVGPNGAVLSVQDRAALRYAWDNNRIIPGSPNAEGMEASSASLRMTPDGAELRVPVQLTVPASAAVGGAARGRLVLTTKDEALVKELDAARQSPGSASEKPPADLTLRQTPWRVTRIESDAKPVAPRQPTQSGGPPGG